METRKTLEQLSSEYDYLVIDTCALSRPYGILIAKPSETGLDKKIPQIEVEIESSEFFNNFVSRGSNLYTTDDVVEELKSWKKFRKSDVKRLNRLRSAAMKQNFTRERELAEYIKKSGSTRELGVKLHEREKSHKRLLSNLTNSDRIIYFVGEEILFFEALMSQYSFLSKQYGITEVDLKLLMSAGLLALKKGKTCLITNDSGIIKSGYAFVINAQLNEGSLSFYIRDEMRSFREAYYQHKLTYSPVAKN
ncbi:MAG: hypothetical protein AABW51_03640 [Nanoarchaeota archaeon]